MSVRSRRLKQLNRRKMEYGETPYHFSPRVWRKGRGIEKCIQIRPYMLKPSWSGVCRACGLLNFRDYSCDENEKCQECGGRTEYLAGPRKS